MSKRINNINITPPPHICSSGLNRSPVCGPEVVRFSIQSREAQTPGTGQQSVPLDTQGFLQKIRAEGWMEVGQTVKRDSSGCPGSGFKQRMRRGLCSQPLCFKPELEIPKDPPVVRDSRFRLVNFKPQCRKVLFEWISSHECYQTRLLTAWLSPLH